MNTAKNITLRNIYALNIAAPKYIKQILTDIRGESDNNAVIVGNFNNPLTSRDRSSRQKTKKKIEALNDTWIQLIFLEHFNPKPQNIHYFEVHMKHCSK